MVNLPIESAPQKAKPPKKGENVTITPKNSNKPLVMLESPYAGNVEGNLTYARRCMRDSLKRGEVPLASHLLYTQEGILNDDDPIERELGIGSGFDWGNNADYIVFYDDFGMSGGMQVAEIYYKSIAKPVFFRKLFT